MCVERNAGGRGVVDAEGHPHQHEVGDGGAHTPPAGHAAARAGVDDVVDVVDVGDEVEGRGRDLP